MPEYARCIPNFKRLYLCWPLQICRGLLLHFLYGFKTVWPYQTRCKWKRSSKSDKKRSATQRSFEGWRTIWVQAPLRDASKEPHLLFWKPLRLLNCCLPGEPLGERASKTAPCRRGGGWSERRECTECRARWSDVWTLWGFTAKMFNELKSSKVWSIDTLFDIINTNHLIFWYSFMMFCIRCLSIILLRTRKEPVCCKQPGSFWKQTCKILHLGSASEVVLEGSKLRFCRMTTLTTPFVVIRQFEVSKHVWSLEFCASTRLWKSAWKREMPKNTGSPGFSWKPFHGRCHVSTLM